MGLSCERRDSNRNSTGEPRAKLLCNITSSINASFPKAGAKVRLITGSANLSRLFLEGSAKILCKRLIYKYVIKQDFHERERRKGKGTHYNISGGRALRARITITYRVGKGRAEPGNREQKEGEQSADKGKTVLKGGENGGSRKGKQWFSEKKAMVSPTRNNPKKRIRRNSQRKLPQKDFISLAIPSPLLEECEWKYIVREWMQW